MHPSRLVAAAAAWAAAVLYVLVGLGVLDIGRAVEPGAEDLLAFGLAAGAAQLLVGVAVLVARGRAPLLVVVGFEILVVLMYVAVASVRVPAYEVYGVTIKALEIVAMVATLVLATHLQPVRTGAERHVGHGI
ncbi:hypothetical protein [Actinotalea sp. Marseille-Q4924]|uniref:hypothetical protein n=1 Tax=Actinotalea sp. Marseille-Q4924 TaxID=2866571 RepID=UPI001CE490A8|nr:hypothetical protein [Actinotalea sp. Marseille-Q4924]